jgi:hypothetical protein
MKTFKSYLIEGLEDLKKSNREKEASLKQTNRDKENLVRRMERDKEALKRKAERDKERAKSKKESIIQKVTEYIKADGARKKCHGGDGRRTENHDCDKVHSDMTHKEWEASQDTPKDETKK